MSYKKKPPKPPPGFVPGKVYFTHDARGVLREFIYVGENAFMLGERVYKATLIPIYSCAAEMSADIAGFQRIFSKSSCIS